MNNFIASDSEIAFDYFDDFEIYSSIGIDNSLDYADGLNYISFLLIFNIIALGLVAGILLGMIFWRSL